MRKTFRDLSVLLLLLAPWSSPASACTGFAVYGEVPVYGMNFDYPEVEVMLAIRPFGDTKIFEMKFFSDGSFIPTAR